MDLSEKHLSWITARALPVPEDLPEGEYPFDEAKAGEGTYYLTVRRSSVFPDLKSSTPEGVYMKSKGPVVPAQCCVSTTGPFSTQTGELLKTYMQMRGTVCIFCLFN